MNVLEEVKTAAVKLSPAQKVELLDWLSSQAAEVARGIFSTPSVCGGDPCIRHTRIPVWLLESLRRQGLTNEGLVEAYPSLLQEDLGRAWSYVAAHREEIDQQILDNESKQADRE